MRSDFSFVVYKTALVEKLNLPTCYFVYYRIY